MHGPKSWTLATAVLAAACSSPAQPAAIDQPGGPNTLTNAERLAGWRLLFDGTSTTGWRGFKQTTVPSGWQAVDGALTRTGGGGDLITIEQFANFELLIQWQIAPRGNSGIMFRVSEAADAPYLTGPEMQVLDNAGHPDGASGLSSAGACYGLYPPSEDATRPVGAWNDVRLVVSGAHVEHWMNGVKIVEYRHRKRRLVVEGRRQPVSRRSGLRPRTARPHRDPGSRRSRRISRDQDQGPAVNPVKMAQGSGLKAQANPSKPCSKLLPEP